jgi:DNA replication and repair protein RecF
MYVRSLHLQQFRNYREDAFEFDPSLNLICGPNAQGKTSLLEAIYYLMIGRSFRPCRHQDLIRMGSPSLYLEAIFCKHGIDQKLRLYMDDKERKIIHNSTVLPSVSNLLGLIQGVIMTPDDVDLVKGPPCSRRQFLDIQIAQVDPLYVHYLSRYVKAMRHRNHLLKQKKPISIESWEYEMAHSAGYIVMQRKKKVQALQTHCHSFYAYLTDEREHLSLEYQSGASLCQNETEIKEYYLQLYQKNRSREMILGHTLSGPHKDDIAIKIGGRDARYFSSEGQQRSSVIALHMGAWEQLKQAAENTPLFMIDDVGISLDEKRRERLLHRLACLGQVFLTTTDTRLIDSLSGSKKVILLPLAVRAIPHSGNGSLSPQLAPYS